MSCVLVTSCWAKNIVNPGVKLPTLVFMILIFSIERALLVSISPLLLTVPFITTTSLFGIARPPPNRLENKNDGRPLGDNREMRVSRDNGEVIARSFQFKLPVQTSPRRINWEFNTSPGFAVVGLRPIYMRVLVATSPTPWASSSSCIEPIFIWLPLPPIRISGLLHPSVNLPISTMLFVSGGKIRMTFALTVTRPSPFSSVCCRNVSFERL